MTYIIDPHRSERTTMNIIWTSKENLDKRSLYIHTRGSNIALKDVEDGTLIDPAEIVIYEDENSKAETQTITSVIDTDGTHYATNSRFFREDLQNIHSIMTPDPYQIIVRKQVSKAGRTFVTCELA